MCKCLAIVGATAVGKSELAYEVGKRLGLVVISADSRQCYRELNIGVAKPSRRILQEVKHYFIDSHSVRQEVNVGGFQNYAYSLLEKELKGVPGFLLTGGTGLYVQFFLNGSHEMPIISSEQKHEINQLYLQGGLAALQESIQQDQDFVKFGEMDNPERLMRALMVYRASGKSIFWYRKYAQKKYLKNLSIRKIGIFEDREALYAKIDRRVEQMLDDGWLLEVENLAEYMDLPALRTIGYQELWAFLQGKCSLENSVKLIKQYTRNYAKRQETWFRRDKEITWIRADNKKKAIDYLCEQFTSY